MLSWDVKTRLDSQLSRMNCQMFSTGLSSGHLGGSGMMLIFPGTSSFPVMCHTDWAAFNDLRKGLALGIIQQGGLARRLSVEESV